MKAGNPETGLVIALDGPAGTGKSTVALRLAEDLGITYLETGALYRAVALLATEAGVDLGDEDRLAQLSADLDISFEVVEGLNRVKVAGVDRTADLRSQDMGAGASRVASLPKVRAALLELQRAWGRKGGVVAEGRDIGTVVFPEATVKIFLTASAEERARRRQLQLEQSGNQQPFDEILRAVQQRDRDDSTRATAPLKQAQDATLIDCTNMTPEQVIATVRALIPGTGDTVLWPGRGMENYRSGLVAILGRPNVGKSTLLNAFVGCKLAIVTPKPQTTRHRIMGILTGDDFQVAFVDTPGIHESTKMLNNRMVQAAWGTLEEVDLVCLVLDVEKNSKNSERNHENNLGIIRRVREAGKGLVLVLNKIDLLQKDRLLPLIASYAQEPGVEEIIPVSAKKLDGVKFVLEALVKRLPQREALFPAEQLTDRSETFRWSETIREKVLLLTHQEIPHSVAVTVRESEYRDGPKPLLAINAAIHVERPSQKGIVIGKGGAMLRQIGEAARHDIEAEEGIQVHLALVVRVEKDWSKYEAGLKKVEYQP